MLGQKNHFLFLSSIYTHKMHTGTSCLLLRCSLLLHYFNQQEQACGLAQFFPQDDLVKQYASFISAVAMSYL